MLLVSPAGKTVLIDAGPPDAADKLAARLKELVHGPIDLMLMTHPHADHIGGMEAALHAVGARLFMEPGYDHPSPIYSQLLKALDVAKVTLKVGKAGNNVELGGGATMHLLAPSDPPFTGTRSDADANSIVMRVVYGKTSFYLAADSEDETEKRILATGEEIGSDVYKVAHHASRHSSSAELLAKIHPRIAVVSVGANNEYGHPTRETLDRLEAVKAEVLRTDLDGEIVLKSDGEHVTYTTEKSDVLVTVAPTDDKGTQPATHPSKVATATHKNGATDKPHDTVAKKPVPDEVVVDTSAHKAAAVATTSLSSLKARSATRAARPRSSIASDPDTATSSACSP